jgi:hypothetical protein
MVILCHCTRECYISKVTLSEKWEKTKYRGLLSERLNIEVNEELGFERVYDGEKRPN